MLGVEELFDLDRILLTYIFQIQVPAVLVPRSPVKMEESAKMGIYNGKYNCSCRSGFTGENCQDG